MQTTNTYTIPQPDPAERLKHHRKAIAATAFNQGMDGVKDYKDRHPEAAPIKVQMNTVAYAAKPKGYADYLATLVDTWIADPATLASSNTADVTALNAHFGGTRFNPANHFSKAISGRLRAKLAAVFEQRGHALAPDDAATLSKVKAAAKACALRDTARRPFGKLGTISGNRLTIGTRSFPVEKHNGHDCARVTIGGARYRLRLDALEAILAGIAPGELSPVSPSEPPPRASLSERIAALRADAPATAPDDPSVDPLTL
jgi:hypothetical protein